MCSLGMMRLVDLSPAVLAPVAVRTAGHSSWLCMRVCTCSTLKYYFPTIIAESKRVLCQCEKTEGLKLQSILNYHKIIAGKFRRLKYSCVSNI